MANEIQLPPPPSADSRRIAADHCAILVRERAGLRRRLASSVATFCALDGPARLGYASRRDYARNALGVSPVRLLRLRRVGALCLAHPVVGDLAFSVIDRLAQRLPADAAPALVPRLRGRTFEDAASLIDQVAAGVAGAGDGGDAGGVAGAQGAAGAPGVAGRDRSGTRPGEAGGPTPPSGRGDASATDSDYQRISFTVPASVAAYLEDTIQLASALLGHDAPEADCIDAVVAEASTEIPEGATPEEARRCFAIGDGRPGSVASARSSVADPPTPPPRFRCGERVAALVLDRYLRRLLSRERTLATRLEDAIHDVHTSDAHRAAGYGSFADFGRRALDMAPSTLHDHLVRARLRRRRHPIAEAVASGRLAPAKAQLVERLHRRCHVPISCLGPWIEVARTHSFRGLCEAVRWAHVQSSTDYRAWSHTDFAPPDRERIRASKRPVTEIARDPTPEILAGASQAPMTSTQWVVRRATLDVLLQLMAGSRAQAVSDRDAPRAVRSPAPPAWWCLLHVFVTARRQWSAIERKPPGVRGQVLRRDDYRCTVPVCSERRSLEVHHIRFRSAGGEDSPHNLVTLCAFHHRALHDGRLRIHGRVIESAEDLRYELAIDGSGRAQVCFRGEEVGG